MLRSLIAALAYAGAAFLFGLALGERGELGPVQYVFLTVIPLTTLVLTFLARHARIEVLLTGLAMFGGVVLGQKEFARAFADCPLRMQTVRAAVLDHQARHGDYPTRLPDLGMPLPCRCLLRRTILHYASDHRGFRLWISNDASRVEVTASERSSGRSGTTPPPTPAE